MVEKLRELNEALPEMLLIDVVYLILGELIILLFVPNTSRCAIGFLGGVLYSIFGAFQMSFRIRKVVYGRSGGTKTFLLGYFVRLAVMFVLLAGLYVLDIGDLLCALIGMFSMKVSAYIQPFTNNFLTKILRKGR